eukprot:c25730_g1_i1 orf=50-547(+)
MMKKVCVMWVLVVTLSMVVRGIVVMGQESVAEAPDSSVQQADCSGAMDELSVCNVSISAASPAPECCDALRSLGPQCMCNVFLGPPIPGLSRDEAFLLPRNCNLARIRCTAPPSSASSSSSAAAAAPDYSPSASSGIDSVFFLGADDVDDDGQRAREWAEQKKIG